MTTLCGIYSVSKIGVVNNYVLTKLEGAKRFWRLERSPIDFDKLLFFFPQNKIVLAECDSVRIDGPEPIGTT